MANLLPFILSEEQDCIKQEIGGRDISLIFTGTISMGKTMVILNRYVADNWTSVQRMILVRLLAIDQLWHSFQLSTSCHEGQSFC